MSEDELDDAEMERWRAKARWRLRAWVLIGDVALAAIVVLSVAGVTGGAYGAYYMWFQSTAKMGKQHFLVFLPILLGGLMLFALAYGWFTTRGPVRGVRVSDRAAPELHALVRDCAAKLGVKPPHEVWLIDECSIGLATRLRCLAIFGTRRSLAVGAQLLSTLSVDQARAMVGWALGPQSLSHSWAVNGGLAQRTLWNASANSLNTLSKMVAVLKSAWLGSKIDTCLEELDEEQLLHADESAVRTAGSVNAQAALLRWAAWQALFERGRMDALSRAQSGPLSDAPRLCRAADAAALGNLAGAKANLMEAWNGGAAWGEEIPRVPARWAAMGRTRMQAQPPLLPAGGGALQRLVPSETLQDFEFAIASGVIYQTTELRTALAGQAVEFRELEAHPEGILAAERGEASDADVVADWLRAAIDAALPVDQILDCAKRAGKAHAEHRWIMATWAQYALQLDEADALDVVKRVPDGSEPMPSMHGELKAYHARHGRSQEAQAASRLQMADVVVSLAVQEALEGPLVAEWVGPEQMPPAVRARLFAEAASIKGVKRLWLVRVTVPHAPDLVHHAVMYQPKFFSFQVANSHDELTQKIHEKLKQVPGASVTHVICRTSAKRKLRKEIEKSGTLIQLNRLATPDTSE